MIDETLSKPESAEPKRAPASCVKFSDAEYKALLEDTKITGKSIPTLLKTAYFTGRRAHVLMNKEDQERWYRELRQWGNNLNQLARRVNAGLSAEWHPEFENVRNSLLRIENLVLGVYGDC